MNTDHKNENTIVAIADDGKWQYYNFSNADKACEAVNKARSEGKAAVIYDGSILTEPPNICIDNDDDSVD